MATLSVLQVDHARQAARHLLFLCNRVPQFNWIKTPDFLSMQYRNSGMKQQKPLPIQTGIGTCT